MNAHSASRYLRDALLRAWACAIPENGAIYLAGAITTGLRYADNLANGERIPLRRIADENSAELRTVAARLREELREIVVEPASWHVPEWEQADYHALWSDFIKRYARLVVVMPGWEYSLGAVSEFLVAVDCGIAVETLSSQPVSIEEGIALILAAAEDLAGRGNPVLARLADHLRKHAENLKEHVRPPAAMSSQGLRKDASLDRLAEMGLNVAQFASFQPVGGKPRQAFCRLTGREPNIRFADLRGALEALLHASADRSVNVRSYDPHSPQSREFVYGLKTVEAAAQTVERLTAAGLHTIVNETIDVSDGGVSGVLMGGVLEFAPDDTPRCVEKPGTASLPRELGRKLLASVYGIAVDLPVPYASRLEFSLHPRPRGWQATNIVTWEYSEADPTDAKAQLVWPNKFSRMIGDKTFGLLIAHHSGLPVPRTIVINRRVAPFAFGRPTGWKEHWIRTAPHDQMPGLFTTRRGWTDPFNLLQSEDPRGAGIASILAQEGVFPHWSGALIVGDRGELFIEGCSGSGENLMLGEHLPEALPPNVELDVRNLYSRAQMMLGPVRFEWVHDGKRAWVVQLHRGATETTKLRLVPGDPSKWLKFEVSEGLPALRALLEKIPPDTGLHLSGRVGLTSHIADTIRKASIPTTMGV